MKAIIFPGKFYQGPGAITKIADLAKAFHTKKPMIIWGKRAKAATVDTIEKCLGDINLSYEEHLFTTDCTKKTAEEIADKVKEAGCDLIIGIGGGKVLDNAKAVAVYTGNKMIIAPTIASNDAPTSACTVWYDDAGVNVGLDLWPVNPDAVIADTEIMVKAPVRMLKAGIGDALATNIEALASMRADRPTCAGGTPTQTVKALTQLCFDTLMENAEDAVKAVEAGVVTPAFEKVVEANVLLSGIGWESGGLCTAHTFGNGIPDLEETHDYMHGEKVAFGIVTELVLDPVITAAERKNIVTFMARLGLPVCFEDLNMQDISRERLYQWCVHHTTEADFVMNHAFEVTADSLCSALIAADCYGKGIKDNLK